MSPPMRSAGFALLGFLIGTSVVSMYVGGKIGLQQVGAWPAWLAAPLGASMGPYFLVLDVQSLLEGKFNDMIALPQSWPGGLVGALIGWMMAWVRNRMPD